jgi:lipopolysaccharide transport system permease protein
MQNFSSHPKEIILSFWRNRSLIKILAQREVYGRYKGSIVGIAWPFLFPLIMLVIYTFVFSVVFKTRWQSGSESNTEFALILFAGLLIFNLFSECISRAPNLILGNVNFVKKIVFPLEILPWVIISSGLFHLLISLFIWLVFYYMLFGIPHASILIFPFILLPFIFFILGLCWIISSICVYFRDISQLVGVVTTILMFLSPIFYPISALPENYQIFFMLNPITPIIEMSRNALIFGALPNLDLLGIYIVLSLLFAYLSFVWFQRARLGFADVI